MKITKISINKLKSIGLPRFSSVKIAVGLEAEVGDEDLQKAYRSLWSEAQKQIDEQTEPYIHLNPEAVTAGAETNTDPVSKWPETKK